MLKQSTLPSEPCHIVITGGAGFLGVRLARALLAQGQLSLAGAAPVDIGRITLVDRAVPPADLLADARVGSVTGDLECAAVQRRRGRCAHRRGVSPGSGG